MQLKENVAKMNCFVRFFWKLFRPAGLTKLIKLLDAQAAANMPGERVDTPTSTASVSTTDAS